MIARGQLESRAIKITNENRRRNVVRVLAAYLVESWTIAQVAGLLLPE
jgi:hypothetical protein